MYDIVRYSKTRGLVNLLNGYPTYPLAKLLEHTSAKEKDHLAELFREGNAEEIVKLIEKSGVIDACVTDAERYAEKGYLAVAKFRPDELRNVLRLWMEGNKIKLDRGEPSQ